MRDEQLELNRILKRVATLDQTDEVGRPVRFSLRMNHCQTPPVRRFSALSSAMPTSMPIT